MKRNRFLFSMLFLLALALCMNASADEFPSAEEALDRLLGHPYFVLDTITAVNTDDYSITANDSDPVELIYVDGERATSGSAEFVSGDEWMKELVTWIPNFNPGEHAVNLSAHEFHQAGEAVFHITAEAKGHQFEKDYTLRIIPYPQNAFVPHEDKTMSITPGREYSDRDVIGLIADLAPETDEAVIRYPMFHGKTEKGEEIWLNPREMGNYFLHEKTRATGIFSFEMANSTYGVFDVTVGPEPYSLAGPTTVYPGTEIRYAVEAVNPDEGMPGDFVLTAEGAEIDGEGRVTLREDAKVGDQFTITAVSAKAEKTFTLTATVAENPLHSADWTETEVAGFTLPLINVTEGGPEGPFDQDCWDGVEENKTGQISGRLGDSFIWVNSNYNVLSYTEMHTTFQDLTRNAQDTEGQWARDGFDPVRRIYVNGCPVVYGLRTDLAPDGTPNRTLQIFGQIDRRSMNVNYNVTGNPQEGTPPLDDTFVTEVFSRLKIEGEAAEILTEEPKPALAQAEEITETAAGANVQYTAGDADPLFGSVAWSVTDAEGQATKAANVDKNGLVKTNKSLKETTKVLVLAKYEYTEEPAKKELTIYPAVKKINVEATDNMLYLDGGHSVTLTAKVDPEGAKLTGLNWSMNKEGFAELKDNEDGTATLTPACAGALTVTVTDEGGKKGTAKITVTDKAVTAVEITTKGQAKPGKTVTCSAKLTPDKPAKKDVTWSVNVDESIATINTKGQLKIAKNAAPGTVITVTCTATGAATPVTATADISVE